MPPETIVVTGVGGPAGRAAHGYFSERGHRVVGTDVRPVEGISAFRKVPLAADPAFLDALIGVVAAAGARLLIPTVSEELPIVAEARGFFRRRGCNLFISSAEASRTINDKWLTAQALEASGVTAFRTSGSRPTISSRRRTGRR